MEIAAVKSHDLAEQPPCQVSYMKFSNGTYKPWAEDPSVRETIEDSVLYTYYAFYLLVILFAFLVLPLAFFFHLIGGDDGLQVRSVSGFSGF